MFDRTCQTYAMIIIFFLAVAFIFLGMIEWISIELTLITTSILLGFMISITIYCIYKNKHKPQYSFWPLIVCCLSLVSFHKYKEGLQTIKLLNLGFMKRITGTILVECDTCTRLILKLSLGPVNNVVWHYVLCVDILKVSSVWIVVWFEKIL